MRRLLCSIVLLLGSVSFAWAGAEIIEFEAYSLGDHCQLVWQTGLEENLKHFIVERSSDGSTFLPVGLVKPEGSQTTYQYTDISPLAQSSRIFFYRLKILDRDNTSAFSIIREVSLVFSAFHQTWGSIKAMFR